jgi:hypothetical protein
MGRTAIMDNDGHFDVIQKKLRAREMKHVQHKQRKIVASVLKFKFKKYFNTKQVSVGNRTFVIDLMSGDGAITVKIINSSGITSDGNISSAKFQSILSSVLVLKSIRSEQKLLVFTNMYIHEQFCSTVATMPKPIFSTSHGIEIVLIPLLDDYDDWCISNRDESHEKKHDLKNNVTHSEKRIFRNRNQIEKVLKDAQDDWK